MDSFEVNKIIAAILVVFIVVFGIGKFSDIIFHVEKPKTSAYKIDTSTTTTTQTSNTVQSVDISALLAMGDVDHGKTVFKKCSACHVVAKGGKNKIGPALYGVMGRKSGSVSDYKYSKALMAHAKVWSYEEMNGFLLKPSKWVPRTKMAFAGLRSEKDRASVILYMNSQSDNPLPKP